MAGRNALIVGAGSPAADIAAGLADLGWAVSRLDDDSAAASDATVAERIGSDSDEGLSLVVHARYPAVCRRPSPLTELSPADWHAACDEPLEAAIRLARGAHAPLAAHGGCIVFVVPLTASAGGSGFAPFAAAAEGCRILAKSLARSWGAEGIRAHSLMLDPSAFLDADAVAGIAESNALHDPPLGRVPDPRSEVAAVIGALAEERFEALVGSSLVVDGGLWMPG